MGKASINMYTCITLNGISRQGKELNDFCLQELSNTTTPEWLKHIYQFIVEWLSPEDFIIAKTSGSTGIPKSINLQKKHMIASAQKTNEYFKLTAEKTALLCLSANYIAGKMMIVRSFVGGFNLVLTEPSGTPIKSIQEEIDFVAMVPLQVYNSLQHFTHDIKDVIIGGGVVSEELKKSLVELPTQFYETYGMTETVSHVAIKRISQDITFFEAMPNVNFELDDRDCLKINAPDISPELIVTNDIVRLKDGVRFEFLGRFDHVINTGGVKIIPEEVEGKLVEEIKVPFLISSVYDNKLGEKVVLVLEEGSVITKMEFTHLTKFETPKEIVRIDKFPVTETGKIKRLAVKKMIAIK